MRGERLARGRPGAVGCAQAAAGLAEAAGAKKVVVLAVSGAVHSPLMEFAVPGLKDGLAKMDIQAPKVPLISNVEARPVTDAEAIRALLLRQLTSPVRRPRTSRKT